jgi:hypothetical protein
MVRPATTLLTRGVLAALLLGPVGACQKKERVDDSGPASPAPVIAELSGAKKGYVGRWVQTDGNGAPAYLDIGPRGGIRYSHKMSVPPYREENIEGLIAAFHGNDIEVSGASPGTVVVTDPPEKLGGRWQMRAMKKNFER